MRKSSSLLYHFVLVFAALVSVCQAADYREGYLLVKFKQTGTNSTAQAQRQALVTAAGGECVQQMYTSLVPGLGVVKLPAGASTSAVRDAFIASGGVQYAEYDYKQTVQAVPNDPRFGELWGMHNTGANGGVAGADIDAVKAWDLGTGSKDIIVAVIDTGVDYMHPDLAANMWVNTGEIPGNGIDDDGNGYVDDVYGYDFYDFDGDPMDVGGHGTHCAGTIGAVGNNGVGVAGVCWNVRIMALRFLGPDGGYTSGAISSIEYAVRMGATFTSNSWGGGGYSQALYDAITAAGAANQLFIAAAGNGGFDGIGDDNDAIPHYPSNYDCDNIISVMSTTNQDLVSGFSNFGLTSVDLAAPGSAILSTVPGGYAVYSGTSMATPHVAGAAALLWSINPLMSADLVKDILLTNVDSLSVLYGKSTTGGRLNVFLAATEAVRILNIDETAPFPDPMEWEFEPAATGLRHIVMKAVRAKDDQTPTVEYYFDCLEDDSLDSGWQQSQLYQVFTGTPGTTYTFRVKARDTSENLNETAWSRHVQTTTSAVVDDLPPAPGPISVWGAKPRQYTIRRTEKTIFMQAGQFYDESGLRYTFDCIWTNDPGVNADQLDKVQTTRDYIVDPSLVNMGYRYTFTLKVEDLEGNALLVSPPATVSFETVTTPKVLKVPLIYPNIQTAVGFAVDGDIVELQSNRIYTGPQNRNIDFGGLAITIRGENPQDPNVVASTIIDCEGSFSDGATEPRRAFIFQNGEGANSIISGLTIINGFALNNPESGVGPDVPGQDAKGGAILCENGSSPSIINCVIRDCYAQGQSGGRGGTDGADGADGTPGTVDNPDGTDGEDGQPGTGSGAEAGDGLGGAIYCGLNSSPLISGCIFENTFAIGGLGGAGGQGGQGGKGGDAYVDPEDPNSVSGNGGNGGNGGAGADAGTGGIARGGAMFFEGNNNPIIENCRIIGCLAINGQGISRGGEGGAGGLGSGPDGTDGQEGQAGPDGSVVLGEEAVGGALYFGSESGLKLMKTDFLGCRASSEGGALFMATKSTLQADECRLEDCGADPNNSCNAVYLGSETTAVFTKTVFENNIGTRSAVWTNTDSHLDVIDCDFIGNESSLEGAAISVRDNSILTVSASRFLNNTTTGQGGAIYGSNSLEIRVETSVFETNSSGQSGGAIYAYDTTLFEVTDTEFSGNIASGDGDGGAICWTPDVKRTAVFKAIDCTFTGNTAGIDTDPDTSMGFDAYYGDGGAISIFPAWVYSFDASPYVAVENCTFVGNDADTGGAVSVRYTGMKIDQCTFTGNISEYGGAVFWNSADVTVTNSSFDGNKADNTDGDPDEIKSCSGGALYGLNASFRIYNCKFAENAAELEGGAMHFSGWFDDDIANGTQDIINCLATKNTAVVGGGAVSVSDGAMPFLINCTMVGNTVTGLGGFGGAIGCQNSVLSNAGTYVLAENCILWDNMAEFGSQAAVGDPLNLYNQFSMLELSHSNIQGGSEEVFLGEPDGNCTVYAAGGVINADPLFTEITLVEKEIDRTYYLQQADSGSYQTSPCVNTGTGNVGAFAALLGFDPTTQTNHQLDSVMDMGFHYDASGPVVYYTVTTSIFRKDHYAHGTIQAPWSPGVYANILQGSTLRLEAVPNTGYRVARWIGSLDDASFETVNDAMINTNCTVQVEFELDAPRNLFVPESFDTIEDAVLAARSGDTVVLSPNQVYLIANPDGINFGGKQLVIRSADPNDPAVVASTVIDCRGSRYVSKRAFRFSNGEQSDSKIEGITIRNAFTAKIGLSNALFTDMWPWPFPNPPAPLPPVRALSGMDGNGDSYGGAILCENGSSPTIRNCVFENCTVSGGIGGDGQDGMYPPNMTTDADYDSQSGGHSGKGTGNGYGGAIAILKGSSPVIINCTFRGNRATGGWGGIPGDAGHSYNSGRYGWGGNDINGILYASLFYGVNMEAGYGEGDGHGGAIYVEADCSPQLIGCTFENNYARPGYISPGGAEGAGNAYPDPWDSDPWGQQGMREGRDGQLITFGTTAGGALFLQEGAEITVEGCQFVQNEAYNVYTYSIYELNHSASTRGGAIYCDPNTVLTIQSGCVETDCKGSDFIENIAGALFCSTNVRLTIDQARFVDNASTRSMDNSNLSGSLAPNDFVIGGAITIDRDANAVALITDTEFFGNVSRFEGGAIRTESDLHLVDCVLNGNSAASDGGAIFAYVRVPTPETHSIRVCLDKGELSGNEAQGFGGAIFAKNVDLILNDVFMVRNTAFSGGGLRLSYGQLDMNECLVFQNVATGVVPTLAGTQDVGLTSYGFGFLNFNTGEAETHRSITAEGYGGGLHIADSPFVITNTRFEENQAQGVIAMGGALNVTGGQSYYTQELHNCLLTQNTSGYIGGAIACREEADIKLVNCTLADNVSAAGSEDNPTKAWDSEKQYLSKQFVFCSNGMRYKSKVGNVGQNPMADAAELYWEKAPGGAIYVDQWSKVSLDRSIVSGNKGIAIYERPGANLNNVQSTATYSLFCSNAGGDLFDGLEKEVKSAADAYGAGMILTACAEFASGDLGDYYLVQANNPAVNPPFGGSYPTAVQAGLDTFTTSVNNVHDSGPVDLGFHYIPVERLAKYTLKACFVDETEMERTDVGHIKLDDLTLPSIVVATVPRGAMKTLEASLLDQYYLTGWSGGTFNDNSLDATNYVLMTRDKDLCIVIRARKTLYVGGSMEYDTLGDAIDAAQDGDIILVSPGQYTAATQYPSMVNNIVLDGKKIRISGYNPADEAVTRATVFRDFRFNILNVGKDTVIEGITLWQSRMNMFQADITLKNSVFRECQFFHGNQVHGGNPPAGTDGYHQGMITGGALSMVNSSPDVINCIFEDNSVRGGDGENGFDGAESHPTGGDGGWPSPTYGGAVYCGLSSKPTFLNCRFIGNEVFGGNGGNGGNGWVNDGTVHDGGRGGGWVYDAYNEDLLINFRGIDSWDGWINNSDGDLKYGIWNPYSMYFGMYDFELWAKWFNWGDTFSSWEQFFAAFNNDFYNPQPDVYDAMPEVWRYSAFGGAVYCEFDSDVTFIDCVFENNRTNGGLTGIGGELAGEESHWPDRQLNMPTAGGAVYATWDSDLTFRGCVFSGNVADTSTVDLPHTFNVSFGGAVAYENDCNVTFEDCQILDNEAAVGGGVYGRYATTVIADSNMVNNEAFIGAGMYLERDEAVITKTVFESNLAKSREPVPVVPDEDPGQDPDEPVIPAATLDTTGMGGGLFAHLLKLSIRDSVFVSNSAEISGGGLLLSGAVERSSDVFNCLFIHNIAQRDGGGASLNWLSQVNFGNCTFADNKLLDTSDLFVGHGGGLFVGTNSKASLENSIFWNNGADKGLQISIGTASEFDDPAELTVSHTDVAGYPSINAIFQGTGAVLNTDLNVFSADPMFEAPADIETEDRINRYFLNQQTSACKDAGSQTAISLGLDSYTTSIQGARDKGKVDLGYHYLFSLRSDCAKIDEALVLSGDINLEDWAKLTLAWLNDPALHPCGENNHWCDGADLNFDGVVDMEDIMLFLPCWLVEDTKAPEPNPVQWAVAPVLDSEGAGFAIKMEAKPVQDDWWSNDYIEYYFDCIEPADSQYDSGWQLSPEFKKSSLVLNRYTYQVFARDGRGNQTLPSQPATVDPILPAPVWARPPFVNSENYVEMEIVPIAVGAGLQVEYSFTVTPGGEIGVTSTETVRIDTRSHTAGSVLTYTAFASFYRLENGAKVPVGLPTQVTATLTYVPGDLTPPMPNPAQHTLSSPIQFYLAPKWYHVVTAVESVDIDALGEEGDATTVEYRFICSDSQYSSGGAADRDNLTWRNVDNVAGLYYYDDFTLQVPQQYWAPVGLKNRFHTWTIIVRDRAPAQNETLPSIARTVPAQP
jgi:predicted outer membrane repeat protein